MLFNKRFDIGTAIYPRVVVLAQGRRPRANTTARGQITVPISNILMTILLHNYYLKYISFKNIIFE